MTAKASPDHSRCPPRYLSAARTLHPTAAAICGAVFVGQSVDAISERTSPTIWSVIRPDGRSLSVGSDSRNFDTEPMTQPPTQLSIELAAKLRNAALFLGRKKETFSDHENLVTNWQQLWQRTPSPQPGVGSHGGRNPP